MAKPIALAADHGGFELKEAVKAHLDELGLEYIDFGTHSTASVDYPDMALPACDAVVSGQCSKALLFCGTGVGISMAANKVKGIRACCCSDSFSCEYTRRHNDANALCMGGRVVGPGLACQLVDLFLNTEFDFGTHSTASVDYPDMALPACDAVVSGQCSKALLFCGTGVGISMAANKVKGIRACCCSDSFSCEYTRRHNDANALCMGGRVVGPGLACQLVDLFLNTEFEGGRHEKRIAKLMAIENR